jgi:hypothetical protein
VIDPEKIATAQVMTQVAGVAAPETTPFTDFKKPEINPEEIQKSSQEVNTSIPVLEVIGTIAILGLAGIGANHFMMKRKK